MAFDTRLCHDVASKLCATPSVSETHAHVHWWVRVVAVTHAQCDPPTCAANGVLTRGVLQRRVLTPAEESRQEAALRACASACPCGCVMCVLVHALGELCTINGRQVRIDPEPGHKQPRPAPCPWLTCWLVPTLDSSSTWDTPASRNTCIGHGVGSEAQGYMWVRVRTVRACVDAGTCNSHWDPALHASPAPLDYYV